MHGGEKMRLRKCMGNEQRVGKSRLGGGEEAKRPEGGPKGRRPEAKGLCAGCQGAVVEDVWAASKLAKASSQRPTVGDVAREAAA